MKHRKKLTILILVLLIHGIIFIPFVLLQLNNDPYISGQQAEDVSIPVMLQQDEPPLKPLQPLPEPSQPEAQKEQPEPPQKIMVTPEFFQSLMGQKEHATAMEKLPSAQAPVPTPAASAEPEPQKEEPLQTSEENGIFEHETLVQNLTPEPQKTEPAEKLTFADLMNGFLNQKEQADESNNAYGNAMHVEKLPCGKITEDQLRHERYHQKILNCIVNSYKIHRKQTPHIAFNQMAVVSIILKNTGEIYELTLLQSSGNRIIDDFILFIFNDASSSFPPVPQSFNTQLYRIVPFSFDAFYAFESASAWAICGNVPK